MHPWLGSLARPAHRSHLEAAATYVSTSCGVLLGQRHAAGLPCGAPDGATRDALDRLLPSHFFVPVPAHRGFSLRQALARQRRGGDRLFHDSAIRFGGLHRLPFWAHLTAAGVFFPSRCVHALPLTPLSPLPRARDARACTRLVRAAKAAFNPPA